MPAEGWVDLSTGVNPLPWPADPAAMAAARRLPDSGLLGGLRAAAAAAYGCDGPARVALAPGTQALIQWLPRLRPAGRVAVVAPTYGEHAPAWAAAGHLVEEIADPDAAGDADVVVLTRPNNPDGKMADRDRILALARALGRRGGQVVVDEAFADLDPALSLVAGAPANVIILRSFGKFFGWPGLRLGFALADPQTVETLRRALGPWPVSSVAAEIGTAALADAEWQARTRAALAAAAGRLDAILGAADMQVVGGTSLFRYCRHAEAARIHARLGGAGIHVRRFPEDERFLRFGLPGPEAHWRRLERALAA